MSDTVEHLRRTLKALRVSNTSKIVLEADYLEKIVEEFDDINNKLKDSENSSGPTGTRFVGGTLHGGGFK